MAVIGKEKGFTGNWEIKWLSKCMLVKSHLCMNFERGSALGMAILEPFDRCPGLSSSDLFGICSEAESPGEEYKG